MCAPDPMKSTFCDVATLVRINLGELLPDGLKIKVDIRYYQGWPLYSAILTNIALAVQRLPELGKLVEVDALVAVLVRGVDQGLSLGVRHLTPDLIRKTTLEKFMGI